jgi:hypothetical protein
MVASFGYEDEPCHPEWKWQQIVADAEALIGQRIGLRILYLTVRQ